MNWVNLGFLGVCASALCFVLWNVACKTLGVVKTAVALYLTPVAGVIAAVAFLGERLTPASGIGGGLVVFGVIVANWSRRRKS